MFYTITHKLHGDDLGALVESDTSENALKILFRKGNFGEEHEKNLLVIEEFSNIQEPLSKIKYVTLSDKRMGKRDQIFIQWYKGWGNRIDFI